MKLGEKSSREIMGELEEKAWKRIDLSMYKIIQQNLLA